MERYDWATLFPEPANEPYWARVTAAKPSLAERMATRSFQRRHGAMPWYVYGTIWAVTMLIGYLTGQFTIDTLDGMFLLLLALFGCYLSWQQQGFCDLLLRSLAEQRALRQHGAPARERGQHQPMPDDRIDSSTAVNGPSI